eukprot:9548591-Lingulodinium_polyedra.AAC.1
MSCRGRLRRRGIVPCDCAAPPCVLPCHCHVIAMSVPCRCHAIAIMIWPLYVHVVAVLPWYRRGVAMLLPR